MITGIFLLTLLLQLNPGTPSVPEEDSADANAGSKPAPSPNDAVDEGETDAIAETNAVDDPDTASDHSASETESSELDPVPQEPVRGIEPAPAAVETTPKTPESTGTGEAPEAEPDPLSVPSGSIRFKPGKGLLFESEDGSFAMAIRSRMQLRHEYFHNAEAEPDSGHVLMVRRARVNVAGHVFGEHSKYKLQLALSPRDMQFGPNGAQRSPVLDAILEYDYLRDATVSAGQFMVPWNRQRIVSSGDFELVDRSIASGEFNLDRDIGVQVSSNDVGGLGRFRYLLGAFNGEGRDAMHFADSGLLYVGRIEVLPFGDSESRWDYEEGHLDRRSGPRVSLGAAYAYHDHAARNHGVLGDVPSDGGTTNLHLMTADFVAQWAGASLMGEIYRRDGSRNFGEATVEDDTGAITAAPRSQARDGGGYFVQAGYVLPWIPLGLAARYSRVIADKEGSELANARELGGGPSYYFASHDFKLQADYFRVFEEKLDVGSDFVRTQLTMGF